MLTGVPNILPHDLLHSTVSGNTAASNEMTDPSSTIKVKIAVSAGSACTGKVVLSSVEVVM